MASEYWIQKFKDIKPEEKRQLTKKEMRANWWHYHKWHVAAAIVLLAIVVDVGKAALGIGRVLPDYQIAYVGTAALPDDTVAALERAIAAFGTDSNGDGQVIVQINQYVEADATEDGDNAYYTYASEVTLMADLEDCDSYFFLLEQPEDFQQDYQILCRLDGSLPADGDRDYKSCYLNWSDCPVLSALELGSYSYSVAGQTVTGDSQELLSQLSIARRGFWTEKTTDNVDMCNVLWAALTEGVLP